MGRDELYGIKVGAPFQTAKKKGIHRHTYCKSGYLESCRSIVTCARTIADTITSSIPELYILGSPPGPVIAFASKHPRVNVLEVGDAMSQRGWHLNALSGPAAVHIACTVSRTLRAHQILPDHLLLLYQ